MISNAAVPRRSTALCIPGKLALAMLVMLAAPPTPTAATPTSTSDTAIFSDASDATGLRFKHLNANEGKLDLPEITGPGAAFLDYDGDGDLDLYLVQGARLRPRSAPAGPDRLLSNRLLEDGRLSFVDVTEKSGLSADGYGMGVATGDIDNDGDVDLFVTNFGPNQMWRNDGGRFSNVTQASTTAGGDRWSVSASFVDFDGDGWLDLYVANYAQYPIDPPIRCYAGTSRLDYCGPSAFAPQADRLYRNRGDGSFEDISLASGVARLQGPSLGVLGADLDGDHRQDVYIANDGAPNFLWVRSPEGKAVDQALLAGLAVNQLGQPEASMGLDLGDYDRDGDEDLFLTHLTGESNTLYSNLGDGIWEDSTIATGLALPSRAMTGFGIAWLDYDNDGWLDLAVANGLVRLPATVRGQSSSSDLGQSNQLWRNLAGKRFEEVSDRAGPAFQRAEVSRGLARGDVDNDGDVDLLVANNGGPAQLLLNQVGQQHSWLGLRLLHDGRDAIGALAELTVAGEGAPIVRRVHTDGSYASASDPRLTIGLGDSPQEARLQVRWPDGTTEEWDGVEIGRYQTLTKGSGRVVNNRSSP